MLKYSETRIVEHKICSNSHDLFARLLSPEKRMVECINSIKSGCFTEGCHGRHRMACISCNDGYFNAFFVRQIFFASANIKRVSESGLYRDLLLSSRRIYLNEIV